MTLSERIAAREADGYCAPHGARMPHYSADGRACEPDSPEAQARARAIVRSPFTRRAIARQLPGKVTR